MTDVADFDLRRRLVLALPLLAAGSLPRAAPAAAAIRKSTQFAVSIAAWGAHGGNAPDDAYAIQRALDEAPIGSELHFPPGEYRITRPLRLTRRVDLIGHGAYLRADFGDESLLTINIEDKINRDNRNQRIEGLRLFSGPGRGNALLVTNHPPNVANVGMRIENNIFSASDEGSGNALRLEGIGTHHLVIRGNQIENGIHVATADGVTIEDCLIFGIKTGITLDLVNGAFQTRIFKNAIVSRDSALVVKNGSQIYFEHNTIEQFPGYGRNQSDKRAHIAIFPRDYTSRHIQVIGNNFGGGDNAGPSIYVEGQCWGLYIDRNVFNVNASPFDIVLDGPGVAWTRLGAGNTIRGASLRRPHLALSNPLAVDDRGTGTAGIWLNVVRPVSPWRASERLAIRKSMENRLEFQGALAGQGASGSIIARLPIGFRPIADIDVIAAGSDGGAVALRVEAVGIIRLRRAISGAVSLDGVSIPTRLPPAPSEE